MLTPEYMARVAEGSEQIASDLHDDIVRRIIERMMLRIGRGETELLTSIDKWNIELLQEAGYLREDIEKDIASRTKRLQKEIKSAFEHAGVQTIAYDDRIYKAAGLTPPPLKQTPGLIRIMQRAYEATMGEWKNATRTTATAAQTRFINAVDLAYHQTATGALSYTQAVQEAVDDIAQDGIYIFYPEKNGRVRKDTVEVATARAVRTGVAQMSAEVQFARMDEMGVDLVMTSSHLGARPSHQEWQGKIFSRSGSSDTYPELRAATGYGTAGGLCGVNCRHSVHPYIEGMRNNFEQYDSEENKKAYDLDQKQRAMERQIRKGRREIRGLETAVENCGDENLRASLQAELDQKYRRQSRRNAAYRDFSAKNGLKEQPERLRIAKAKSANPGARSAIRNTYTAVKFDPEADYSVALEGYSKGVNANLSEACFEVAEAGGKDGFEHMMLIDLDDDTPVFKGDSTYRECNNEPEEVGFAFWKYLKANPSKRFAFVHNHNMDSSFSEIDMRTLLTTEQIPVMIAVRNDGVKYIAERKDGILRTGLFDDLYEPDMQRIADRLRNGEITPAERARERELTIVDNLLRDYTKKGKLVEIDGRKK